MTEAEITIMAKAAGLDLPPEYQADLLTAYARIAAMLSRMPTGRARGDEPAHIFAPEKFLPETTR